MMNFKSSARGLVLAGALGALSVGQSAQAAVTFEIVDSNTFTITISGGDLSVSFPDTFGFTTAVGSNAGGNLGVGDVGLPSSSVEGASGVISWNASTNEIVGVILSTSPPVSPINGEPINASNGQVLTISNVLAVDLNSLQVPSSSVTITEGANLFTGVDKTIVFVPEPSSGFSLIFAAGVLLLRRKRA